MKKNFKSNHDKHKKEAFGPFYKNIKSKKKDEDQERKTYLNMLSSTLNLPSDMLTGAPIITIIGKNEISIENYKRIIEYTNDNIKILTSVGNILIQGKHLKISYLSNDEMKITGRLNYIKYGSEQ